MLFTDQQLNAFANYCKNNIDLNNGRSINSYQSLSICIIDCVYSLRAKYETVTVKVVKNYADKYMDGKIYSAEDTVDKLIDHIKKCGGCEKFAKTVLDNRQRISRRLKSEVCYDLAQKFVDQGINTLFDFQKAADKDVSTLEDLIISVKGIGRAALNYLFMLAGDQERCKPDVHILRFVSSALNLSSVSGGFCQELLSSTAERLKKEYSNLTTRQLDWLIWDKGQREARRGRK